MKHIFKILFLFLPVLAFPQGGTWPVKYNDSDPSGAPSAAGTRIHFNTATNTLWFWEPAPSAQWRKQPKSFDQISGCAAPGYTPTARQSTFAVNSCTPKPELYQWTGSVWALLNPETLYTAGTGISIASGVISNTGDLSSTNELNVALYIDGGSLKLDDEQTTVSIPLSQFRNGIYSAGTGIAISGGGAISNTGDLSTTNEIQTLSIAGQNLSLSNGGGTVAIPTSDNIYTADGTTTSDRVVTVANGTTLSIRAFDFGTGQFPFFTINSDAISFAYEYQDDSRSDFRTTQTQTEFIRRNSAGEQFFLKGTDDGFVFSQQSAVDFDGAKYDQYYPDIENNPQSMTDVQTVQSIVEKKAFNGNYTSTGTATTAFTVTLPTTQPDATYSVSIMPKNALSATGWYISARTTNDFTVTYLTALTGAVDFDYIVVN